jgi:hypothetical protein
MILEELPVVTGPLCHLDNGAHLDRLGIRSIQEFKEHWRDHPIVTVKGSTDIMSTCCRQLLAESAHILFTRNTFMLDDKVDTHATPLNRWLVPQNIALPVMPRCYMRLIKHMAVAVSNHIGGAGLCSTSVHVSSSPLMSRARPCG